MTAVPLGIALGALDVLVIAIGMAVFGGAAEIAMWVAMFGIVPGLVLGGLLGWLAAAIKAWPIWFRRFALWLPAMFLVMFLGAEFGLEKFILSSLVPTAVATLILEGRTRLVEQPVVPRAQARR